MGCGCSSGGAAADQDHRPRARRRRTGAGAFRRHEGSLRSEVRIVTEAAWVEHAIWWQVYPLGFVGAYPAESPPGADEHRLHRVIDWFDHAIDLGASGIALGPI